MTISTAWAISVLYGLGGILPIFGIWRAGARIWVPVRAYEARKQHAADLRESYEKRQESVSTDQERDALEDWMKNELSKKDKLGIAYDYSDASLFGYSPLEHQADQFEDIRRDVFFVGLGVACATAASIWSIWGGTPPLP